MEVGLGEVEVEVGVEIENGMRIGEKGGGVEVVTKRYSNDV